MEFGELIPLFFAFLCLIAATAIGGSVALVLIRFLLQDKQLAKNILLTLLAVCIGWVVYPFLQLGYAAVVTCGACPGSAFHLTREHVLFLLGYSLRSLIFGIPCGYVVGFAVVLPITLAVRAARRARSAKIDSLPPNNSLEPTLPAAENGDSDGH